MEIVLNTFGVSLNRDNEAFVITSKDGRQRIPVDDIKAIQISRGAQITSDAVMLAIEHDLRRFSEQYQLEQVADKRTSDVTRACFLSVDRDAHFNFNCGLVDMGLYVQQSDTLSMFDLMAKQKNAEKEQQPVEETSAVPSDPDKEIMDRIKQCLHPNSRMIRKRPDAFVPEQLNLIIEDLVTYIQDTGLVVTEIIDIQYGKKIRISMGMKQAEINLFFGKRGFSVVKSPRSGTNGELNDLSAQLIQSFVWQL